MLRNRRTDASSRPGNTQDPKTRSEGANRSAEREWQRECVCVCAYNNSDVRKTRLPFICAPAVFLDVVPLLADRPHRFDTVCCTRRTRAATCGPADDSTMAAADTYPRVCVCVGIIIIIVIVIVVIGRTHTRTRCSVYDINDGLTVYVCVTTTVRNTRIRVPCERVGPTTRARVHIL